MVANYSPANNASLDARDLDLGSTSPVLLGSDTVAQGGKDAMRFTAPSSGSYRIICGVPGHALSGMWIWLKIDPSAKQASFGATKA